MKRLFSVLLSTLFLFVLLSSDSKVFANYNFTANGYTRDTINWFKNQATNNTLTIHFDPTLSPNTVDGVYASRDHTNLIICNADPGGNYGYYFWVFPYDNTYRYALYSQTHPGTNYDHDNNPLPPGVIVNHGDNIISINCGNGDMI